MSQIDNVSVIKQSNRYFDGKCVSHTLVLADGSRKTVGVIFPSSLTFSTGAPERLEIVGGHCRVRLAGQSEWQAYGPGSAFNVPGDSKFDIEVTDTVDYVCHFG